MFQLFNFLGNPKEKTEKFEKSGVTQKTLKKSFKQVKQFAIYWETRKEKKTSGVYVVRFCEANFVKGPIS